MAYLCLVFNVCFIDDNILSHLVLLYLVRIVYLGGHHLGKSCSWVLKICLKCLYINFITAFGVGNMFVLVTGHCLLLL